MAQANVMVPWAHSRLRPGLSQCSIAPFWRERTAGLSLTMSGAEEKRTASDARRSRLMAAAQAGDRGAYEVLLRDCVPFIVNIARRRGVPPEYTDDVVQEALLTLHHARATYDQERSFEAWLRVIVERRAIDLLRQLSRRRGRELHAPLAYESHADETANVSAGIEHKEKAALIDAAVAELPPRQQQAVRHLVLEEQSLAEAAALTGRNKGALKVSLHRALNTLRTKMGSGE